MYRGIIFDLDGTLYDYAACHMQGLQAVFAHLLGLGAGLDQDKLVRVYNGVSEALKHEVGYTASSHNKSIYFKHMLEVLHLPLSVFPKIDELYWEHFYGSIECRAGVLEFIRWNKQVGRKIGVLTDYETRHQIVKLERLGLLDYVDVVVTSEEVGIEKPSSQMFQTVLRKMELSPNQVIMVGDNYAKDIAGASRMGIRGYHYGTEFCSFVDLHIKFKDIGAELKLLKDLSRYVGERFDLVQAGGGNISVKADDLMFIKSSGIHLSMVNELEGYTVISNRQLVADINRGCATDVTHYSAAGHRASIETYMHSILNKYTVHVHPIALNQVLVSVDARDICAQLYSEGLVVDYVTPGIRLCNEILRVWRGERVIFLLGHGIIITANDITEVYRLLEDVTSKFSDSQFDKYTRTNEISKWIKEQYNEDVVSYLCDRVHSYPKALFHERPTFPDAAVYCGTPYILDGIDPVPAQMPKVIIYGDHVYTVSNSLHKCKEIEDVFESNLMILNTTYSKNYLSTEEVSYLDGWEAEKYRKQLNRY